MDITTNQSCIWCSHCCISSVNCRLITAFVTMRTNAVSRKNESKLAVLKVLLEAAYKEYEFRTNQDLEEAKLQNKPAKIKSFTEYINLL
ncbi:MAG: hypothetical protein IPL16_10505 [Ignavibacteria bacterium]|nr:hypothetical protein [Ignavibacteria bacterium]